MKRINDKQYLRRISENQRLEKALRQHVYFTLWMRSPLDQWGERICVKCQRPLDWHWKGYEMHHLIPLSLGGKTSLENCQLWCAPCHRAETEHREE